jgi:tRNA pseudouridine38-40 synthase
VTRWKLTVEYDGGPFMGWQRQDHGPSVQRALEEALERMTGERASFTAAGRTDAGVHALAMAAHVDIARDLTPHRLREGLNALLRPNPVSVLAVESVADDWHARFSCLGRRYRYRILSRRAPPALDRGRVWHIAAALDAEAMSEGAAMLVGRHDFTTFRSAHCQSDSPVKTLDRLEVSRVGEEIHIEAAARSFLHHQVRSMVGCLAMVGRGQWQPQDIAKALEARDRAALGLNAPPQGLYFVEALYPPRNGEVAAKLTEGSTLPPPN